MAKRVSSRGIIIEDGCIYTMFRRKKKDDGTIKEYYVIPGGGINENETLEENVKRELSEEFSIVANIKGYLGVKETENTIEHFFHCDIESGVPTLGGEEKDRCTESNYYEIRKVALSELDNIDISSVDMIKKAYNKEYVEEPQVS